MGPIGLLSGALVLVAAAEPAVRADRPYEVTFAPQQARCVRLVILAASSSEPCLDELEVYGPHGEKNLALAEHGAQATASSCLPGYAIHRIEHLNDGKYGNDHSWIAAGRGPEWAQIELPQAAKVSKVVFSRDRKREFADRVPIYFQVQLSLDAGQWKTVKEIKTTAAASPVRRKDQAVSQFDAFTLMEQTAGDAELEKMLASHPDQAYLLFPEDRRNPIRMTDALPAHWVKAGPQTTFEGTAQRGEFYVFQIGVFAARRAIAELDLAFEDLAPESETGPTIPASAIRCFNQGGVDWKGRPFEKTVAVARSKVRALWFGVQVPRELPPGHYTGVITISPKDAPATRVTVRLRVENRVIADAGDGDLWRHARLRWLDSTIAQDDEPAEPFTPMQVHGTTIACLGRDVTLGDAGLPQCIRSYFSADNVRVVDRGRPLLAAPMRWVVEGTDGHTTVISGGTAEIVRQNAGVVRWESQAVGGSLNLAARAQMEFDGYVEYRLQLTAERPTPVRDVRLEIPLRRDAAIYMMGMGRQGGLRSAEHEWRWDQRKHQDSVWLGDVNAGLRCQLFGENYQRPTVVEGKLHDLPLPAAWHNEGRGGCRITEEEGDQVVLRAFSGARTIRPGEALHFNFTLLLTPFRTLDMTQHWRDRYFHVAAGYVKVSQAVEAGANVVNIHQGNELNPYINYPFLTVDALKKYVSSAHATGIKVKIYYTVRELSTRAVELWALRSLGHEVFLDGPGGGAPWLRDHLVSDYLPAWTQPLPSGEVDTSLATTAMSRWHNYYLEGLHWMLKHAQIDGLYLDGICYDRDVMKRVRKVLDRQRPGSLIDWHNGNTFQPQYGLASVALRYMDLFPYVDRVWFGEMFDYGGPPDYWLVEISGIPFGLMGEMIGGDRFRGPVYGMTARLGWGGQPRPFWKVWDEFGMAKARMIGYWVPSCPVKPKNPAVKATVFRRTDRALIALGSWSDQTVACRLSIDWESLALDPKKVQLRAPAIDNVQPAALYRPGDPIPIPPRQGRLLIVEPFPSS